MSKDKDKTGENQFIRLPNINAYCGKPSESLDHLTNIKRRKVLTAILCHAAYHVMVKNQMPKY